MNKYAIFNIFLAASLLAGVGTSIDVTAQQEAAPVSEQSGKITFNPQTGAVGAQPQKYTVPYGYELRLTLDLEVTGSGEAEFAGKPVRFPQGEPPQFRFQKESPTRVILRELNTNEKPGTEEEYFFKARISYDGQIYESPDPTLVNNGPPGDS